MSATPDPEPSSTRGENESVVFDPPVAHPEIIALYLKDVDRTLLRENLKLTPAQRLAKLQSALRALAVLRAARPVTR